MAQFIYLPKFGYIDVDDIIQIHAPNGGEVNLDKKPEIAVRFGSPVFDGETLTNVVMIRNPEVIEFLTAALGLLSCPHNMADLSRVHTPKAKGSRK
jgi:hypothetical protein